MDFEWDEIKALINQKKHRVSFIEASEVFEERYLIFGVSSKRNYLVVSYTERADVIRIISA